MLTVFRTVPLALAAILCAPVLAGVEPRLPTSAASAPADAVQLEEWTRRVAQAVGREMRYPSYPHGGYEQGTIDVSFRCSDSGAPDKVAISKSSGSGKLDRAALRAVERIATLHPLAKGVNHDQVYVARLHFAVRWGADRGEERHPTGTRPATIAGNASLKQRSTAAIMLASAAALR